jgi:hypothetical protein
MLQVGTASIEEKLKAIDTYKDFKKAVRSAAIPDEMKREFVLKWFEVSKENAATKYAVGLKIAQ